MAKSKDYYELLGVERAASADEIRSAYRKLARKLHPDVNKATDAAKKFSEVQEAYDVLSDPEKRRSYDQFGHAGPGFGGGPRGPAGGTGPGSGPFEGAYYSSRPGGGWSGFETGGGMGDADVESIFEQMFGGRAASGFAGRGAARPKARARSQPERGADIEHTITVTFMTAALGGTEQLRLNTPGESGEGQTINVKIPPGIENGAKLRIKGRGMTSGGSAGDIILTVQIGQHPYFRREGLDVSVDVPMTIVEAVQGVSVRVPLLNGTAQVKIPPGAASGKRLRIKGKGITDSKGKSGDFYAVMQIVAPSAAELSAKANKALDEVVNELQNPRESAPWADVVKDQSA